MCLVDDAQWLDRASAETLAFVARRLQAMIVLVMATRTVTAEDGWAGLPQLVLQGLPVSDARALLESAVPGPLDPRVRERIVAESRDNPLSLLELPRWFTPTELAFGPTPGHGGTVRGRVERGFRRQLELLPDDGRRWSARRP